MLGPPCVRCQPRHRQYPVSYTHLGIISESGCPGVADPGQVLVQAAQELNARIVPLVGPSSISVSYTHLDVYKRQGYGSGF